MRPTNQAFVSPFVICTLVAICFTGSIGLGTVWMRHQISLVANANKQLETRLAELKRHLAETTTAIETEQSPAVLMQRNLGMNLGLVPSTVVGVTESAAQRLAGKPSRTLLNDRAVPVSFRIAAGP